MSGAEPSRTSEAACDPLDGLPPDLARVLRDQSIIVPQDAAAFELIAKWANAQSATLSSDPPSRERRLEGVLRWIADPSYVGNYSDAEVVEIYRKWAKGALDAEA